MGLGSVTWMLAKALSMTALLFCGDRQFGGRGEGRGHYLMHCARFGSYLGLHTIGARVSSLYGYNDHTETTNHGTHLKS